MMKIEGERFKNSDTCEVVSYSHEDAEHDIAVITLSGRYPEGWAMNEISDEMVVVLEGEGKLILKDDAVLPLEQGDGAYVPAGHWFAWEGNMVLSMSCAPKFDINNYKLKER